MHYSQALQTFLYDGSTVWLSLPFIITFFARKYYWRHLAELMKIKQRRHVAVSSMTFFTLRQRPLCSLFVQREIDATIQTQKSRLRFLVLENARFVMINNRGNTVLLLYFYQDTFFKLFVQMMRSVLSAMLSWSSWRTLTTRRTSSASTLSRTRIHMRPGRQWAQIGPTHHFVFIVKQYYLKYQNNCMAGRRIRGQLLPSTWQWVGGLFS